MAKDRKKAKSSARAEGASTPPGSSGYAHTVEGGTTADAPRRDVHAQQAGHVSQAHGQPLKVRTDLPSTRDELLALHALERRRRAAAPLGGPEWQAASERIEQIEVHVARIEREMSPPRA